VQALISLTFDDGFRCQFDKALPILDRHGFFATFFLIANQNSTHDLWSGHTKDWWKIDWREDDVAMLKKVAQHGHEIGSHSVSHHPTRMQMPGQPEIEALQSKQLIEERLELKVSSFCYPFYRSHAYLADAVKHAGYEQARGGGVPPFYVPQASYYAISNDDSLDRFNVDCRQISTNENVGRWLRPGYWHVLTFHGIGGTKDGWEPITTEQFAAQMAELAEYRDSGVVEVVTFGKGAARLRNRMNQTRKTD
jgi:peptidoglycan/xylan/chitin deacetylase (PgdA/CDA1 family)